METSNKIRNGSIWQHAKGGIYQVAMLCTIEETDTPAVMYKCIDIDTRDDLWVRPVSVFLDRFKPVDATYPLVTVSLKQNININEPTKAPKRKLDGTSKPLTKASLDAWAKEQASAHEKARKEYVEATAQKQRKQNISKHSKTTEELMANIIANLAFISQELTSEQLRPIIEYIHSDGDRSNAEIIKFLTSLKKTKQEDFETDLIIILIYLLRDELLGAMNGDL